MRSKAADRIDALPEYAFKVVDDCVERLRAQGITPIDFGVGDPTCPTPALVREACQRSIDARATAGYPSYAGALEFRRAVAAWTERRFGVGVDPIDEVSSTIGSKEGIFNFHEAFVNPGDVVLIPSPGYPPYARGTAFAEGRTFFYPLVRESGFLPDLDAIPDEIAEAAKVLWVNYPNSPAGVCPGLDFYEKVLAWCRSREIILASDEAYSEYYYGDTPPPTALQAGKEGVIVFNSLSKRSAMTTYRIGWVAGDPELVAIFRKMKTNIDSGTPTFVQDAAVAALSDESHVAEMREAYRKKRDILIGALTAAGLEDCSPEGTIYIWQRAPVGMRSLAFAEKLMAPEVAVVTVPGSLISEVTDGGLNPGEGYVRFSLTAPMADVEEAAKRISNLKL
jgi:LL-diaminopimelate aminotransferase